MSVYSLVAGSARGLGLALMLGVGLVGTTQAMAADAPIRIGMIPDAGATQVSVEQKAPLQAYLEKALGRPVRLVIPTNYNATVEGLGNGSLDIAYLGGLTYVKAHELYGAVPWSSARPIASSILSSLPRPIRRSKASPT